MDKKAFSLVEMIITITLLVLLATVGFSMAEKYQQNKTNTKVEADLATLSNAFTSYKAVEKKYPDPIANKSYFTDEGMYNHGDGDAFGVHGFITSETLPNKYLNFVPVDIKTNQYYAFGKTIDLNNQFFEIAGVLQVDGNYMSKVYGDYSGETGPYNLIREYNGPSFVADESTENFPYNPDEKLLTAKIGVYSGAIFFGDSTIPMDDLTIESTILRQGNSLTVSAGSFAQIYYSDGSSSTLGDDSSDSTLIFANMAFEGDNNLYTQIKLALQVGSLWTNAAKLDSKSSFEVYTTDTSAAVRGTIFGVTKEPTSSTITVEQGKVQVGRIITPTTIENITVSLDKNQTVQTGAITASTIEGLINIGNESFLQTTTTPVGVTIESSTSGTSIPPTGGTEINIFSDATNILIGGEVAIVKEISTVPDIVPDVTGDIGVVGNPELTYFGELGEYIENSLSGDGYNLVAYAPYNEAASGGPNMNLYENVNGVENLNNDLGNNVTNNSLNLGVQGCDDDTSLCTFTSPTYTEGIFIDNNNTIYPDFIKYNVSSLNLGTDFAIEVSVRGAALKRTSGTYYLFKSDNFKMAIINGYLKLNELGTNKLNLNLTQVQSLDNNTFYKILFIKNVESGKIYLNGTLLGETLSPNHLNGTMSLGDEMYVGSNYATSAIQQWNDIIDYLKIYVD